MMAPHLILPSFVLDFLVHLFNIVYHNKVLATTFERFETTLLDMNVLAIDKSYFQGYFYIYFNLGPFNFN
jgi:hypothetical protein